MAFGGQIINSSGVTILNDTYKNMRLVKQETHSVSAGSVVIMTLTSYSVPIVAISSNASSNLVAQYIDAGGVLNFYIRSATAGSFTAYIFDNAQSTIVSDTYGMQVFNENGQLLFNSGDRYLRVAGVLPIPYNTRFPGYYPTISQSYPVANAAVAGGYLRVRHQGNPNVTMTYDVINTSGGSVQVSLTGSIYVPASNTPVVVGTDRWFYINAGYAQGGTNVTAIALIVDVSGY